jgi:glycosyltransferase involved in cell wall biosynthesis
MNILYVLNSLAGGASLGIYEMVRNLPQEQYRAFAIAPPGTQEEIERGQRIFSDLRVFPIPSWNVERNIGTMRRAAIKIGQWRRGISIERTTKEILKAIRDWDIDVVHTGTSLSLSGAKAAKEAGIPHVWHIKECVGSIGRVGFPMSDAELVSFFGEMSAKILVMSEYIGRFFRSYGCQKLEVLPDGVDLKHFINGSSRHLRKSLNVAPDEVLVAMVASLSSTWKQHETFLKMVSILAEQEKDTRFLMIGPKPRAKRWPHDTPQRYFEGLCRMADEIVPAGRLQIVDYVDNVADIMRSIDVLVHPCSVEPFGRIAIEAMAAGTPVVGPLTGGIAETVVDGETGFLVTPRDASAFADATSLLIRDAELRNRMSKSAIAHVGDRYSIENHVATQIAVYEQLVGNGVRAPWQHEEPDFAESIVAAK